LLAAAGAGVAGADAAGAICTGAAVRTDFGAGCFFAAATAGTVAGGGGVGRDDGDGAFATVAGARVGATAVPGSGVMMLTGGVEAAVGNSALVGLPVGIDGGRAATGAIGGAFHNGS
jgi:hypothetical protein